MFIFLFNLFNLCDNLSALVLCEIAMLYWASVNQIHPRSSSWLIQVCQKSFASSPNLLRHSLTHMGTKPFPCSVCGKRFSQPGVLKRHSLTHSQPKSRRRRSRWKVRHGGSHCTL